MSRLTKAEVALNARKVKVLQPGADSWLSTKPRSAAAARRLPVSEI